MEDVPPRPHILEEWDISVEEFTQLAHANPSLRGSLIGYIAEWKLHQALTEHVGISDLIKDDDHNRKKKGDRRLKYRGHDFAVEVKSLQSAMNRLRLDGVWSGKAQVDASDCREVTLRDGSKLKTTCLLAGKFDILAINLFSFEQKWHFAFAHNRDLPRSRYLGYTPEQREQLLATLVPVTWPPEPPFTDDLYLLLDEIIEERSRSTPAF